MEKPKTSIIWKTSDLGVIRSEMLASGVSIQCTQGTFDTSVLKVILCISIFDKPVSRKWLVWSQTDWYLGFGVEYSVYTGYFWHFSGEGHSGVIRCISDFQKPCVSKTAGFRVKDTSRSLCYPVYVVIVFHLVKQSAKLLGFLLIFYRFFKTLCSLTWKSKHGAKFKNATVLLQFWQRNLCRSPSTC